MMVEQIAGQSCFCSWSGGKDSCLALHRAMRAGAQPKFLVTMMNEAGERSRSHALPAQVIAAQGAALGIPAIVQSASWQEYERRLLAVLRDLPRQGVGFGVFGDIDIAEHAAWERRVCAEAGLQACLPLWQQPRLDLLREFLDLGFRATIVSLQADLLDQRYLGRVLDWGLINELIAAGVDPSGENGEYHTVVTAGPIFQSPLSLRFGERALHSGYWFLEVSLQAD